ncbi:MAG: M14 family metallopeptidase [Pseudomonadota bacterium]
MPNPAKHQTPGLPLLRTTSAIAIAVLLSACASSPLPEWRSIFSTTPATPAAPVAAAPAPAAVTRPVAPPVATAAPQTLPAPLPEVRILPVAPPVAVAASPLQDQPAPFSAAVAARFPTPSITYSTPGLQGGRTTYTTQAEIQAWLRVQASAAAGVPGLAAAVVAVGRSQRGEAIEALVLARAAGTDAAALLANGRPTVFLVGQQHGNEPAGSEALLVVSRELAQGLLRPLLDRINVVIVPRANPDGAAADKRETANGVDMNRDHLLLNTPEAQALAKLARDYHPTVAVDAHEYTVAGRFLEKFGTVQKFDALLQYATTANLPEFLTKASEEWYRRPAVAALKTQGLSNEWYYTTSADLADKKISMGGMQADTGRNVEGLKNTVSLLVETRGVGIGRLHLQRRVHTHVTALSSVLASTAQRASELTQLRPYLDKEVAALACRNDVVVEAGPTPAQYELVMLDPATGADKTLVVNWDSALALRALKTRVRPCGYWLSASSTAAVDRLRLHGVQVQRLLDAGSVLGDSYRETSRTSTARQDVRGTIADGNKQTVMIEVSLARGLLDVPRGSFYVPLNQPLGNLVVAALEPDTQSSFFANQLIAELQHTSRVMAPPALKLEDLP